jgi:hypothetical protein
VFSTFLQAGSANKVLAHFNRNDLRLPRRGRFGQTRWRPPTVAAVRQVLKNPAYAGAFVYGRSRSVRSAPGAKALPKKLPREQWRIVVKDKYPAYVNWETFEKIQAMLRDNYAEYDRNKTRGVPREGEALLHGIVYCGECGHKMLVQYKKGTRYICNYLRQQHGTPQCQCIPANPIDGQAVTAFFQALAPAELNVLARATNQRRQADAATARAQTQQVERLRYRAALAERDCVHTRIVWRGGDVTVLDIPITVGSLEDLSCAQEMEKRIVKLARAGHLDQAIAEQLTAAGFRSPLRRHVLPSTVRIIRLRHGIMQLARQSHPRKIPGYLTVPQVVRVLGVQSHWIYDRVNNGTIALSRDARTKLYLFPDKPATLAALRKLKAGKLKHLTFDA